MVRVNKLFRGARPSCARDVPCVILVNLHKIGTRKAKIPGTCRARCCAGQWYGRNRCDNRKRSPWCRVLRLQPSKDCGFLPLSTSTKMSLLLSIEPPFLFL